MVYGVENHGLDYQTSTATCIRRDNLNLNVGVTCENSFNSANLIHSQISTTTQSTRKRNSSSLITSDGCNIDLSGLTREERRSEFNFNDNKFIKILFFFISYHNFFPSIRASSSYSQIQNSSCNS